MTDDIYVLAESESGSEVALSSLSAFESSSVCREDVYGRPMVELLRFRAPSWDAAKALRDAVEGFGRSQEYPPAMIDLLSTAYLAFPRDHARRLNVARYIREVGAMGVPLLPEDEAVLSAEEDDAPDLLTSWLEDTLVGGEG